MADYDMRAQWPGWETARRLGRGTYGAVYEIRQELFGRVDRAALKFISVPPDDGEIRELQNEGYDSASIARRYETYLKNIVDEYVHMADLRDHPNIVRCDEVRYRRHPDGIGWDVLIKMELLTPLMDALNAGGPNSPIPPETVLRLGRDMANALVFCEEQKLLHRDIKPQNIFVNSLGTFKLGDFGIAKSYEETTGGTKAGTFKYMAPEVFNNRPYGLKADVYSLGLTLYYLLNERRMPFLPLPPQVPTAALENDSLQRRMRGEPLPPPKHGDPGLQAAVLRACAYDPEQRCTAAELLDRLNALGGGDAAAPYHRSPVPESAAAPDLRPGGSGEGTTPMFPDTRDRPLGGNAAPVHDRTLPMGTASGPVTYAQPGRRPGAAACAGRAPVSGPVGQAPAGKKKKWIWIPIAAGSAVLLAVVLLFVIGLFGGRDGGTGKTSLSAADETPRATATPAPAATPASKPMPTSKPAPTAEPASAPDYVMDGALILSVTQRQRLNNRAAALTEEYGIDVRIITVDSIGEDSIEDFAGEVFQEYGLGYGEERSLILLLLSMEYRDYDIMAHGYGNYAFTDYGKEELAQRFLPKLGKNDWYGGFTAYLDGCEDFLASAAEGEPVDRPAS